MCSDLHRAFPHPVHSDVCDPAGFLLAADRLPGLRRVRRAMRARTAVAAGCTLVDLGCGPGWETARLAAAYNGARVVGVDHNPALIAAARARVPGRRPEWVCADLTDSGLPPASVDVVRTERVLVSVRDLAVAVDRLRTLLRPCGRIVAFELDYDATLLAPGGAPDDVVRAATACLERSLPQPWVGRRLSGLLHRHGLTVTAEPHAFAVDAAVWRRIVRDAVSSASDGEFPDPTGTGKWLAELGEPAIPRFPRHVRRRAHHRGSTVTAHSHTGAASRAGKPRRNRCWTPHALVTP